MEEKVLDKQKNGMTMLVVLIAGIVGGIALAIACFSMNSVVNNFGFTAAGLLCIVAAIACCVCLSGLKVLHPQEAMVLTLFGEYIGTLKGEGFYYVHPFATPVNPAYRTVLNQSGDVKDSVNPSAQEISSKKMSLKVMTLSNNRQKINDCLGNPVEISIAVMWRVVDTAKAAFNVDNYKAFLSLQCDSALRAIVQLYPYDTTPGIDTTGDGIADDGSLRGSTEIVAQRIKEKIQERVNEAGLEIVDTRITYLAYAPEIAAAMLQRQQAGAMLDAKKLLVEGAVGMVELALERLNESGMVELDEERKAVMVSNLLVVLCGNREAQPIVNSGSLY